MKEGETVERKVIYETTDHKMIQTVVAGREGEPGYADSIIWKPTFEYTLECSCGKPFGKVILQAGWQIEPPDLTRETGMEFRVLFLEHLPNVVKPDVKEQADGSR
jgi:hypothetical protein